MEISQKAVFLEVPVCNRLFNISYPDPNLSFISILDGYILVSTHNKFQNRDLNIIFETRQYLVILAAL